MDNETTDQTNGGSTWKAILAFSLLLLVVIFGGVYAYKNFAQTTKEESTDTLRRFGSMFFKGVEKTKDMLTLNPKITVGSETIVEGKRNIAELAVKEVNFDEKDIFKHSWLGSTKTITAEGKFVAKAGYRLNSPMELNFSEDLKNVDLRLPKPVLLSCEQKEVTYYNEDGGIWNPPNDRDRKAALNGLLKAAREGILKTSILSDADESMVQQIKEHIYKELPEIEFERQLP